MCGTVIGTRPATLEVGALRGLPPPGSGGRCSLQGEPGAPRTPRVPPQPADNLEPISPELVLVDPELARAERALFAASARLQALVGLGPNRGTLEHAPAQAAESGAAGSRTAPPQSRRRLAPVVLRVSLIANAVLIAIAVVGSRSGQP